MMYHVPTEENAHLPNICQRFDNNNISSMCIVIGTSIVVEDNRLPCLNVVKDVTVDKSASSNQESWNF